MMQPTMVRGRMLPSRFRRPMVSPVDPGLRLRLLRRWLATLALVGGLGLLAAGTHLRWYDEAGPGLGAYWLHDKAYLPLKGYLWTWGFPQSLVAWLVILLLLAVALAGFLSGQPLLRGAHALVARRALANPMGRAMIGRWHAATARTPFRARKLELLAEHARLMLLDRLDEVPEPASLAALTALCVAMRLRVDDGAAARTTILADLLETLLRLERVQGDGRTARTAVERLAGMTQDNLAALTVTSAPGGLLAPATLAAEVQILLTALRSRLASGKGGDLVLLRPVAAAIMERCGVLDALRATAERGLRGFGREASVSEGAFASCGRLSLLIALWAAVETAEAELAHATLESLSALAFARAAGLPVPLASFADIWLAEVPDLPHWLMVARLGDAPVPATSLLTPGDHDHLTGRPRRLAWIAGTAEATP